MSTARAAAVVLVAVATAFGAAAAVAYFSATKSSPQPINLVDSSAIPATTSLVPPWHIDDETGSGVTTIYTPAFADDLSLKTSNANASFAGDRWLDVDLADYAPPGLAAERVTAEVDFSDDKKKSACMYMQARRRSTGAVIATYGSPVEPLGCAGADPRTIAQALAVTSTDVANDLRLRLYFNDEKSSAVLLHRAVIKVTALGETWTLLPTMTNDALDATPTGEVPWPPARVDTVAYRNSNNFASTYDAGKYVELTYPATVPPGAHVTGAQLDNVWKTVNGDRHCLIVETYTTGSLLATHGTPAAPAMCTRSATTWATGTLGLGEVNTPARANGLTVRLYGWGGNKIDLDRPALKLTWTLGTWDAQQR